MAKVLYLNIGWMRSYKGLGNDTIRGGGAFVAKHKWGHEFLNFKHYGDKNFGYVGIPDQIHIERLGADPKDEFIDDVLVVWVSRSSSGGTFITGWYKHARVYRHLQDPPARSNRKRGNDLIRYYVSCKKSDAFLLPEDERVIQIPRGKGGMGQSNLWYGDSRNAEQFTAAMEEYARTRKPPKSLLDKSHKGMGGGSGYNSDPAIRRKVETAAIKKVWQYYTNNGFRVYSVEKDNVGWDLEAEAGARLLRIEVKGLSGAAINVGLTPNEYKYLNKNEDDYRLAIVTNARDNPTLSVFSYSPEQGVWIDDSDLSLNIKEQIAATITLK